jgi:hypothetical protein
MRQSASTLAASLGALIVVTAVAMGSAIPPEADHEPLTRIGVSMVQPEYEMPAYIVGVILAIAVYVAVDTVNFGNRGKTRNFVPSWTPWFLAGVALAVTVAPLYPYLRSHPHLGPVLQLSEMGPVLVMMALAAICVCISQCCLPERVRVPALRPLCRLHPTLCLDTMVLAAVILMVGIHPVNQLASRIYINERFFHWEHFVFTPALGKMSGLRLGTDIYSQYGLAYPILYGWLSNAFSWGYTPAFFLAAMAGVLYYLFAYMFLRQVTRKAITAATGLVLLLALNQFPWTFYYTRTYSVWQYPSATLLRSPLDLVIIFSIWRHCVSRHRRWLYAAGIATGINLMVALDMGVLLGILVAVYASLTALEAYRDNDRAEAARVVVAACMSALLIVTVAALAFGFVSGAFDTSNPAAAIARLTSGMAASAIGGVGASRLLSQIHWLEWLYFMTMTTVYLAAAGRWISSSLLRRPLTPIVTIAGILGLYGLMRGIFFVWNTHPQVLIRGVSSLPLILALWLTEWVTTKNETHKIYTDISRRSVGVVCVLSACVALLLMNPSFRDYPSLLRCLAGRTFGDTSAYVTGPAPNIPLPRTWEDHAEEVREGLVACRVLAAKGCRTVILHDHSTFYYWYGGLPIWGYNPTVYYLMYTQRQLASFLEALEAYNPDYVLLTRDIPGDSLAPLYADVHATLHNHVLKHYHEVAEAGVFIVFARLDAPRLCDVLRRLQFQPENGGNMAGVS